MGCGGLRSCRNRACAPPTARRIAQASHPMCARTNDTGPPSRARFVVDTRANRPYPRDQRNPRGARVRQRLSQSPLNLAHYLQCSRSGCADPNCQRISGRPAQVVCDRILRPVREFQDWIGRAGGGVTRQRCALSRCDEASFLLVNCITCLHSSVMAIKERASRPTTSAHAHTNRVVDSS